MMDPEALYSETSLLELRVVCVVLNCAIPKAEALAKFITALIVLTMMIWAVIRCSYFIKRNDKHYFQGISDLHTEEDCSQ